MQDGRAALPERLGAVDQRGGKRDTALAQERGSADSQVDALHGGLHAASCHRTEPVGGRQLTALARGRGDRACDGMLGLLLDGGRQHEQPVVVAIDRRDARHRVLTSRERAGLVEQHGVDVAHSLEAEAVAHEDALAS